VNPGDTEVRLCDHPRASRQIEVVRSWGALVAFALTGLLSLRAGVLPFDAGIRALIAGIVGYVAMWALAVAVWRHLAVAELAAARESAELRRDALLEGSRRLAADAEPGSD
jgi:hypothetical protein